MAFTLAIDPGISKLGAALGDDETKRVIWAELITVGSNGSTVARARDMANWLYAVIGRYPEPDKIVFEWPQIYQGANQKGDPNDLLGLAAVCGAIATKFIAQCVCRKPREWKGQLPANVCARRIADSLSVAEKAAFRNFDRFETALVSAEINEKEIGGSDHNTADAVGILLHHYGRINQRAR